MRLSNIVFAVSALLSLNLIACADDSSNEPSHDVVTNPLVQDGESCSKNSDCASNLCTFELSTGLKTKGAPAPVQCPDCNADDDVDPAPTPAPAPKGKPEPEPAPAPVPNPTGICAAR